MGSNLLRKYRLRYFIKLAYNGSNYNGWQSQLNAPSVQETINNAFSVLLNSKTIITGAGRTDTGVHAREMYAHFDTNTDFELSNFLNKLNSFLPEDIVIYSIFPVKDTAHSRFDAHKRTYQYHINILKNPFLQKKSWYFSKPLNFEAMNKASAVLLEYLDFECFSKVNTDVASFECAIFEAYWKKEGADKLVFTISANRFLRNMVRSIVGSLIDIGIGKSNKEHFIEIIESKDRKKAGFSVPAHGLYLTKIEYDFSKILLPSQKIIS